jgi:hypothetical protein
MHWAFFSCIAKTLKQAQGNFGNEARCKGACEQKKTVEQALSGRLFKHPLQATRMGTV